MGRTKQNTSSMPSAAEVITQRMREGSLIFSLAISIFLVLSLFSYHHSDPAWSSVSQTAAIQNAAGKAGAYVADIILYFFGYIGYLFPLTLLFGAWQLFKTRKNHDQEYRFRFMAVRCFGLVLTILCATGAASLDIVPSYRFLPLTAGGVIGNSVAYMLVGGFNFIGASLILYTGLLIGITLFSGLSWLAIVDRLGSSALGVWNYCFQGRKGFSWKPKLNIKIRKAKPKTESLVSTEPVLDKVKPEIVRHEPKLDASPAPTVEPTKAEPTLQPQVDAPIIQRPVQQPRRKKETIVFEPALEGTKPPLTLLDPADKSQNKGYSNQQLEEMSRQVELRLKDFGVQVTVVAVHPGPVVTRFELQLAAGTKVSKITGLAKDLARSLSVTSVRVVEVIPGKSVIGIELPNVHRDMVRLRELLSSVRYQQAQSSLSLALGKDIAGHPVVVDLGKMPHLLVAGTTGSGKSVGLNAMLLSLLYKTTPKELRLILIDPKMLELAIYDDIPHLLTPVVTDMKDASNALRWCVGEMERRYRLMASLGVRNIAGYNSKIKDAVRKGSPIMDPFWNPSVTEEPEALEELPSIVVLADEFADMMMVVGKKVEQLIARIAQKARAAGIHLILATQRPSVDVITGLIKANIPARIAFHVSSKIDSRTILDQQGAEQLLGHGDMLYIPAGASVPVRVHGAFVDDDEVHRVVSDLKRRGQPDYLESVIDASAGEDVPGMASDSGDGDGERDALYDEAVQIVTEARKASISSIQRRLKIGYNRAANIVESMEAAGVVGPMENNGSREVLAPKPVE